MVADAPSNGEWDPRRTYDCPLGHHWATTAEAYALFPVALEGGAGDAAEIRASGAEATTYFGQCGWEGFEWGGFARKHFRFADSHVTGAYKHAGRKDSSMPDVDTLGLARADFAGIVCVEGAPTTPGLDGPTYGAPYGAGPDAGGGDGSGGVDGGYGAYGSNLGGAKGSAASAAKRTFASKARGEGGAAEALGSLWDCRDPTGLLPPAHLDWVDQTSTGDLSSIFSPTSVLRPLSLILSQLNAP